MILEGLVSVIFAAIVGAVIGIEREYHDKSAGFRTMVFIAVGSAIFTILSTRIGDEVADGARIAAAIVSGIGFLGAGAIIKDGLNVRGLTTAAAIWLVASLGMGMGAGYYEFTFTVTIGILLIMWFVPPIERKIDALHEFIDFHITVKNTDKAEDHIIGLLRNTGVQVVQVQRAIEDRTERQLHIKAKMSLAKYSEVSRMLANEKSVLTLSE